MILYLITCSEPVLGTDESEHIVFASTDYDAVFERRARITEIDMCHEAHPIRSRHITV